MRRRRRGVATCREAPGGSGWWRPAAVGLRLLLLGSLALAASAEDSVVDPDAVTHYPTRHARATTDNGGPTASLIDTDNRADAIRKKFDRSRLQPTRLCPHSARNTIYVHPQTRTPCPPEPNTDGSLRGVVERRGFVLGVGGRYQGYTFHSCSTQFWVSVRGSESLYWEPVANTHKPNGHKSRTHLFPVCGRVPTSLFF